MNIVKKAEVLKVIFIGGVKSQLKQQWTWGAATSIGLHQGLKYKGNIKTGITGGLATLAVIAGANGIYNIVTYWDKIEKVFKED